MSALSTSTNPLELIADPKVAQLLDVSLRSFARWDDDPDNDFPPPIKINNRKFRRRAELEAWLHKRALASLDHAAKPTRKPPTKIASKAPVKKPTAPASRRPGRPRKEF